ncbi:MAG: MFS transporter [Methanoregulaceae archaeon]|nr:MFS transporter [Methanoregulaceae archaeon]
MTPGLRNPVLWLSAGHMVTDIYMPVITSILPLLIATRGYSYFLAGLLVTTYNLSSSLTQPVFGWLSDRRGWALPLSYSLLISAFFIVMFGFVEDYLMLLVFASLAALGHATFHPNALAAVSRLCSPGNRGKVTSIFVVGGNIGYAVGPLLTGLAIWYAGLPGLALLFLPAGIMAFLLWFVVPEECRPTAGRQKPAQDRPAFPRTPVLTLFGASTLRAWAIFGALAFFPSLLVSRGFSLVQANVLITLMLLAGVGGQIAGGVLSDRYGRKEFVLAGLGLSFPAFVLFMVSGGPVSIIALLFFGFALWSGFAVTVAMAHEMMPHDVGLASGLLLGVAIGAGGAGVAFTGVLADRFSLESALYTLPFLIAGAAVLIYILRYPWKGKPAEEREFSPPAG